MQHDKYTKRLVIARKHVKLAEDNFLKKGYDAPGVAEYLEKADEMLDDALFEATYYSDEGVAWRAKNKK